MGLYDQLSEKDLQVIKRYCTLYGSHATVTDDNLKTFLAPWNQSKGKLYRLLGNSFTHSFVYHKTINKPYRKREIRSIISNYSSFFYRLDNAMYSLHLALKEKSASITQRHIGNVSLDSADMWVENKYAYNVKYIMKTEEGKTKTLLQISENEKPVRAILKCVDAMEKYADNDHVKKDCQYFRETLDKFRCKISTIPKEGTVDTPVVISIHPMDFMTMSDNDSDWQSCMSWVNDGCYHAGTVEMMGANNVVCAFIPSVSKEFVFDEKEKTSWNNKNWRCLFYIEKDIICSGKAYPYKDTELVQLIIAELRKLAQDNMHWTYTEDIAEYRDMKGKDNMGAMNNVVGTKKHKVIVFDTKAMYNDMFNDQYYTFWCVRNKVKKSKKISISGKAVCLECGGTLCKCDGHDDEGYGTYNGRYSNTGNVICVECYHEKTCSCCGTLSDLVEYRGRKYCERCLKQVTRICPCCGKSIYAEFNDSDMRNSGTVKVAISNHLDKVLSDEPYMHDLWSMITSTTHNVDVYKRMADLGINLEAPELENEVPAVLFHTTCWEHSPLKSKAITSKRNSPFSTPKQYVSSKDFNVPNYIETVQSMLDAVDKYFNGEIDDLDRALEVK